MKIIVIEDQTMIRELLVLACRQAVPGVDARSAASGADGLALCRELQPEIALVDLVLPDCDGLELAGKILAESPDTRIIALSSHTDDVTLHRALASRIHGFVDKNEQTLDVLGAAIAAVRAGRPYYSSVAERARAALKRDPAAFNKILSDREQELVALFGRGLTNEEVAAQTQLTPHTVKNHRRNIMGKLGVHSTPQLIHYAIEKGFTRVGR